MTYQLAVNRHDLLHGLQHFKPKRKKIKVLASRKAVLGFDGRFFSIEALDRIVAAHAEGTWPGLAYISANALLALAIAPPDGDPVIVRCDGQRLSVGSWNVTCEWQPASQSLLKLPAAPDWIEALSLKYRAARGHIWAGGYDKDIANAEKQLTKLIARVAKPLSPLGITERDIRSLVEARLAERYSAHDLTQRAERHNDSS